MSPAKARMHGTRPSSRAVSLVLPNVLNIQDLPNTIPPATVPEKTRHQSVQVGPNAQVLLMFLRNRQQRYRSVCRPWERSDPRKYTSVLATKPCYNRTQKQVD